MAKKQSKNNNNHGGSRDGSGRRPKNKTWGTPSQREKNQTGVDTFFSSSNPKSSTTTSSSSRSRTQTRTQTHDVRTVQRQPVSSAPTTDDGNNTEKRASDSSISTSPATRAPEVESNPNYDVVEEAVDRELKRGKKISKSKNLKDQVKRIMETKNYVSVHKRVKETGQMWSHPPTLIMKNTKYCLQECWKEFFQLPVFSWIPDAMLGSDWKPSCPNCNCKLVCNGRSHPPRLIYGQHGNYWLHAPQKYKCTPCEDKYKPPKKNNNNNNANNQPPKEKKQYIFSSTCDAVMKQIRIANPELMDIFPCYLMTRNGIDKKLMTTIIHCAVKGIGPSAMVENMSSWHELEWQKLENQFLSYVIMRLKNPQLGQDRNLKGTDIQKCPEYYSNELGGCVPSAPWLIDAFCSVIEGMRSYLDSECIKRAIHSLILAIDASYKIPKRMMKWGGTRIYEALISGTNEYNEVPLQFFATSDNHDEIRSNIKTLKEAGMNPHLAFSDDPTRDESLLKEVFSNLRTEYDDDLPVEETPESLKEMTTEKSILYLYDIDKATTALSKFREDVENATLYSDGETSVKVAFDAGKTIIVMSSLNCFL